MVIGIKGDMFNWLLKLKGEFMLALLAAPLVDLVSKILSIEYIPIKILILTTLLIFIDILTGLGASRSKKIAVSSKLFQRSVWKYITYCLFLFALVLVGQMKVVIESNFLTIAVSYCRLVFVIMTVLYELTSIGENIAIITGRKLPFFDFLEKLSKAVEDTILKKLGK